MKLEDYFKYYIQGSDHYLIPKDIFMELYNEMDNWRKESKQRETNWEELKKWLEEESTKTIYQVGHLTSICMALNKMQELESNKVGEQK